MKGKRQNQQTEEHIAKIIATYQFRTEAERFSLLDAGFLPRRLDSWRAAVSKSARFRPGE